MDVYCLRCKEPWDTHHMRWDAIWEVIMDGHLWPTIRAEVLARANFSHEEAQAIVQKWWPDWKLTPAIREGFKASGWEFGENIFVILQCPSCDRCPHCKRLEEPEVKPEVSQAVNQMAQALGDDLDAFAGHMEDMQLWLKFME